MPRRFFRFDSQRQHACAEGPREERRRADRRPQRRYRLRVLLGLAAAVLLSAAAGASAQTWSGGGGTDGSWSTSANWVDGIPIAGTATTLTLGATTGTSILNQDLASSFLLNKLTFTSLGGEVASYTLTGGALEFAGTAPRISLRSVSTTTQTINNQIILAGPNGLEITALGTGGNSSYVINGDITSSYNGNVTLTLSGGATRRSVINGLISDGTGILGITRVNTSQSYYLTNVNNSFSGNVILQSGTLYVASVADVGTNSALGTGSSVFMGSGGSDGVLSLSSGGTTPFSTNRNFYLNATGGGGGQLINDSSDVAAAFVLSGGIITAQTAGTKNLTLTGNHRGNNAVNSDITDGAGVIRLYKRGNGLWILGGDNSFSGGATIVAGSLRVTDYAANLGSGNLKFANSTASTQNVLEANGTLTVSIGTGNGQIAWVSNGGLAAGSVDLTVRLNNDAATPLVWNSGSFVTTGNALQLGSGTSLATITLENPIDLAGDVRTIWVFDGAADVDAVISGTLSGAGGSLMKNGPGTLRLTASNSFDGLTTVAAGTLAVSTNTNLVGPVHTFSGGSLGIMASGSFTYTGTVTGTGGVRILSGNVTLAETNSYSGGTTVHTGATWQKSTGSPALGVVTLEGGTLDLGGSINYTATTFTSFGGNVVIGSGSSLATDTLVLAGGVTNVSGVMSSTSMRMYRGSELHLTPGETYTIRLGTYSSNGAYAPLKYIDTGTGTGGAVISGSNSSLWMTNTTHAWIEIEDTVGVDRDLTIEASIIRGASASLHFLKLGAGTMYLPNANPQMAGNIWFYNGTLEIGDNLALGTGMLNLRFSSAGLGPTNGIVTLKTDDDGGPSGYTLNNPIQIDSTGTFGLAIAGSSSLTLTGIFTNSSAVTRTVYFNTDPGTSVTIDKLVLSNINTARTLVLSGTNYGIINSISGGALNPNLTSTLMIDGSGTFFLTGNNTYGGATTIFNGTVLAGNAGAFGSGSMTLTINANSESAHPRLLTAGAVNLARNIDVMPGTAGSAVTLGGSTAVTSTFSGNITFSQNINLTATTGGTVIFAGVLTGSAGSGITKTGAGTVRLQGDNTYAGPSTVSAGILWLAGGGTLTGSVSVNGGNLRADGDLRGSVIVQNGGTLQGTGSVGAVQVAAGGNLAAGNSVGTLTIDGDQVSGGASLTLTGGANVLFEFRDADDGAGTGWDLVDLASGGTLNLQGVDSDHKINLKISSWLADNSAPGLADDFVFVNTGSDYSWLFIQADNLVGIAPSELNANYEDYFAIDDSGVFGNGLFARPPADVGGTPAYFAVEWRVDGSNTGLYLTYHAVPEPGSLALAGIAALAGGYRRWKRRRGSAAPPAADAAEAASF